MPRPGKATVRFEIEPGEQLQSGWGEVLVEIAWQETKLHFISAFCLYYQLCLQLLQVNGLTRRANGPAIKIELSTCAVACPSLILVTLVDLQTGQ